MFSRLLILTVFLSAALGARGAMITSSHIQRSLQPGEVVLFQSRSSVPLARLVLKAFGLEFPAFSVDQGLNWSGFVGIDLDVKPGEYSVELQGTDPEGNPVTGNSRLLVVAKKFPTRRLRVEEKFVTPPSEVLARIETERKRVNGIFNSVTPDRLWEGPFRRPVPGSVISSFGKRSIYNGKPRSPHLGVDFRGTSGTPIRAPNAGMVVLAANLYFSGYTVIIDHGLGLYSYLGHMSSFSVREGDRVAAGDLIGKVGATGVVTGPHLHWTMRLVSTRIDPLSLLAVVK